MATSSALPSSPPPSSQTPTPAPPNFYAQAATAQPAQPDQQSAQDTATFKTAIGKLLTIFGKIEKLKPNGINIEKKIKAVADSLRELQNEVTEGEEGEGESDTDLGAGGGTGGAAGKTAAVASPPPSPAAVGGVAGTGA